jgi:hypothetical protein
MRRGVALAIVFAVLLIASSLLVVPSAVRAAPAQGAYQGVGTGTI